MSDRMSEPKIVAECLTCGHALALYMSGGSGPEDAPLPRTQLNADLCKSLGHDVRTVTNRGGYPNECRHVMHTAGYCPDVRPVKEKP